MFEQMRHASEEMRAYGNDLASHWLGADLDAVRDILSSTNLDKRLMCHSTSSYVRMITACIRAGDSHRARSYLTALEREADDKAIVLGHEATTPLLFTLCRGSDDDVLAAVGLHMRAFERSRPCAPAPSLTLCSTLTKRGRLDEAARVLLQMSMPAREIAWVYVSLTQRVEGLRRACEQLPDGTPERAHVSQLIQQARRRFDLPEEISGQGSHQTTIQDAAAAADAVPAAVAGAEASAASEPKLS